MTTDMRPWLARQLRHSLALAIPFLLTTTVASGSPRVFEVSAVAPPSPVEVGYFHFGTAVGPEGTLDVNNRYMVLNGKPWLPVMGEFPYSQVPSRDWRAELAKMRSAGVDIVSSYVIWNQQEPRPGRFDWKGSRDLRHFVELCAQEGLKVILRIGPWVHAEARFGGSPYWVVRAMPVRRADPTYLRYVTSLYDQIGKQVRGLLWKDGGPVIGVQIENEYNLTGPQRGPGYIGLLKHLAVKAGLNVPLYTVTGWNCAVYPAHAVTPVFDAYPARPWVRSAKRLPPSNVYLFRFKSRVSSTPSAASEQCDAVRDAKQTPFFGAEFAGGAPIMYARRPLMRPSDIAAMLPVMLGSGVNLYGYYLFQGGENPQSYPPLEESTASGGINGLPTLNYGYQAPLGAYGQERPVLGKLRPFHYFLNAFGSLLAPMTVYAPKALPKGPSDFTTPRWSVRTSGRSGFLFFNSYIRNYRMVAFNNVQFRIDLPGRSLYLPRRPIDIPSGSYFIWPFNLDLGGARLRYATAQLMTQMRVAGNSTFVFRATPGIPVQLAFDRSSVASVSAIVGHARSRLSAAGTLLVSVSAGVGFGNHVTKAGAVVALNRPHARAGFALLEVSLKTGRKLQMLILSERAAEESWVFPVARPKYLLITPDQVFSHDGRTTLQVIGKPTFGFDIFPALVRVPPSDIPLARCRATSPFECFRARTAAHPLQAVVTRLRPAGRVPPIRVGGLNHVALKPYPQVIGADSAAWTIRLPKHLFKGLSDAYLTIRYQGDIARLFSSRLHLMADQFYYGAAWHIGLRRFAGEIDKPLTLTVLPLRKDAPVYIQGMKNLRVSHGQVCALKSVTIEPEYQWKLQLPGWQ